LKGLLAGTRWCREADSVVLAVHEALINANRHGGGAVALQASVDRQALVVEVCDRGAGFEIAPPGGPPTEWADPFAEDGRGLWLISQLADRVETGWRGGDFCLRMWFEPPGGPGHR
jgi:anti-sigma regulatory factor (Ser/Thr protein kinase)